MSHITEFRIKDLAGSSRTITQKLDRHINVFFGPNGSGKTSLLKILHSAMASNTKILKNISFDKANLKIYSSKNKKTSIYNMKN